MDPCCHSKKLGYLNTKLAITRPVLQIGPRLLYQSEALGSGNVTVLFKLDPNRPCCHGDEIFTCCHKSSASVKQWRATITLGFATLPGINFTNNDRSIINIKQLNLQFMLSHHNQGSKQCRVLRQLTVGHKSSLTSDT